MWSVFLWQQLFESRSGGTPFCAFGGDDCAALWDGPFASAVHSATGIPVAGWGLLWGLLATFFPAVGVFAKGERRASWMACSTLVGLVGAVGVLALLGVSAVEGGFCSSCALTYGLTLLYAIVACRGPALAALRQEPAKVLATSAVALALGWLTLLLPGGRTPENLERAGLQAVAAAGDVQGSDGARQTADRRPLPDAEQFLAGLEPDMRQGIADSIGILGKSATPELAEPDHFTLGSSGSPVRFTEWTDVLCGHCATLHATFEYFVETLPEEEFALVSRHFPLDGNCNRHLQVRGPESVRCLAAKAQICIEPTGHGFTYAGALFRAQRGLDAAQVYALAGPFMGRSELETCVASPATEARLAFDVDEAWKFEPEGTPLVLIDGRQGTHFGPFLYTLALTGGQTDHPALALLPPADPEVVANWGDHSGHDH